MINGRAQKRYDFHVVRDKSDQECVRRLKIKDFKFRKDQE